MDLTRLPYGPAFPLRRILLGALLVLLPLSSRAQSPPPDPVDTRYPTTVTPTDRIRIGGAVRLRFEDRKGQNVLGYAEDDDNPLLSRIRLDLRWKLGRNAEAFLEVQDTRVHGEEVEQFGEEAETQLQAAFFRWVSPPPSPGAAEIRVQAGRQEIAIGSERLVGTEDWTNASWNWDAVRLDYRKTRMGWTAIAAEPGADGLNPDEVTLLGWAGSWRVPWRAAMPGVPAAPRVPARIHDLEPQIYFRSDSRDEIYPGDRNLEEWTLALRSSGPLPRLWSYDAEGAFQAGAYGRGDILAWAVHGSFRRVFGTPQRPLLLTLDADWATGDGDPGDDDRGTFDPLFPTFHGRMGEQDLVGWSNVRHLGARLSYERGRIGTFTAAIHFLALDDPRDAWRNARGQIIRPGTSWAGRELGSEIDFIYTWTWNEYIDFRAAISRFRPGDFVSETGPDEDLSGMTFQGRLRF